MEAVPFSTLSKDSERSIGSSKPLIVTASVMEYFRRLSTWSFIKDCRGEITTVSPLTNSPLINAGTWKVIDFPPPVGKIARSDLPFKAAFTASSCKDWLL